jgi:hypothetical protein
MPFCSCVRARRVLCRDMQWWSMAGIVSIKCYSGARLRLYQLLLSCRLLSHIRLIMNCLPSPNHRYFAFHNLLNMPAATTHAAGHSITIPDIANAKVQFKHTPLGLSHPSIRLARLRPRKWGFGSIMIDMLHYRLADVPE